MASNQHTQDKSPSAELSNLPSTVLRGLKVLASELKWQLVHIFRRLETRQMNKRLEREHRILGEAVFEKMRRSEEGAPLPPPDGKMLTAAKQIEFLRDEIEHLRMESRRMRSELVSNRSKDLGFE
jgi:hypothetical protein